VFSRQRRSKSGNGIFDASLMKRQEVKISFNNEYRIFRPAFFPRVVEPEQNSAFMIYRGFR
jgi:hypothetical protein